MPYVQRQGQKVIGVYACQQPGYAEEFLPDGHADILAMVAADAQADQAAKRRQQKRDAILDQILDTNKPIDQIRSDVRAGS